MEIQMRCEYTTCGSKHNVRTITIIYGKGFNGPDQDILYLCESCRAKVKADALKRGYKVIEED